MAPGDQGKHERTREARMASHVQSLLQTGFTLTYTVFTNANGSVS